MVLPNQMVKALIAPTEVLTVKEAEVNHCVTMAKQTKQGFDTPLNRVDGNVCGGG